MNLLYKQNKKKVIKYFKKGICSISPPKLNPGSGEEALKQHLGRSNYKMKNIYLINPNNNSNNTI